MRMVLPYLKGAGLEDGHLHVLQLASDALDPCSERAQQWPRHRLQTANRLIQYETGTQGTGFAE
eukprot:59239-Pyramimonas_sp.AAC.1